MCSRFGLSSQSAASLMRIISYVAVVAALSASWSVSTGPCRHNTCINALHGHVRFARRSYGPEVASVSAFGPSQSERSTSWI